MWKSNTATFLALPVELLHYIFDHLDIETILLSLRQVCRFLRSVVQTYDRFVLDFRSISKSNFRLICRIISVKNVITIRLADQRAPGQIDLFISLVRTRQLTRLRSLELLEINESDANIILKHINVDELRSLTIKIQKYDQRRQMTTGKRLSSVIARSKLLKLNLGIESYRISTIHWPSHGIIQHLTISEGVTFNNLCTIFHCSPYLHTLVLKDVLPAISSNDAIPSSVSTTFRQLTSLTMTETHITVDQAEYLLSYTPQLIHLKMIVQINRLDGKQWEQFIQINLPMLEKFEIFFSKNKIVVPTLANVETVIASFQSPFWFEHKHWWVTCDYEIGCSTMNVYTIPVCISTVKYTPNSKRTSLSDTMDNVNNVSISMTSALADDIEQKKAAVLCPMFRRATKLHLDLTDDWPLMPLSSLSILVDLSQLVEIELKSCYLETPNVNALSDIATLIQSAHNLSSLLIHQHFAYGFNLSTEDICCIIPTHLKHLQVPIDDLRDIEIIVERCNQLSSIQCDIRQSKFSKQIVQWIAANTIDSTYRIHPSFVTVWLGRKKIPPYDFDVDRKRVKLGESSEDQSCT